MNSNIEKTIKQKMEIVLSKNTFYYKSDVFENEHEGEINSQKETLLILKNSIDTKGLRKEIINDFLSNRDNGLRSLLALTGLSEENLQRLITLVRVTNNPELSYLTLKDKWCEPVSLIGFSEWKYEIIEKKLHSNSYFRECIVNLFFEGASIKFLAQMLPTFELKKLGISKLKFEIEALIDTLVRYKNKGSHAGKAENNPEILISGILDSLNLTFEKGDLNELVQNAFETKRTMDFIVPNKSSPHLIIESSYLMTTSSNQGDKSKTEIQVGKLLKQHYPKAKFIGFVDGIGWLVRQRDLQRMISAYDEVFTFHPEELARFKQLLIEGVI